MLYRVMEGKRPLPHFDGVKRQRINIPPGGTIEGPDWWQKEFAGWLEPIDQNGNVIKATKGVPEEQLQGAKAHEAVQILEDTERELQQQLKAVQERKAKAAAEAKSDQAKAAKAAQQPAQPQAPHVLKPGTAQPSTPAHPAPSVGRADSPAPAPTVQQVSTEEQGQ